MVTFTIPGEFTTFNQYHAQTNRNRFIAAKTKKEEGWRVVCAILDAFGRNMGIEAKAYPIHVHFRWFRKNTRTDPDNIRFAAKFILDGMQQAGFLKNDGMGEIRGISDEFLVDKERPRVEVVLVPIYEDVHQAFQEPA